ncbi:MAG: tetratricopeptide repeat protein, partial [bacterium]
GLCVCLLSQQIFAAGAEALTRARELKAKKEFKEALLYYTQAVQLIPDDNELLKEAAQLAGWAGEYDVALGWYGTVLKKNPQDLDCELGKAFVLSWKREYQQAIEIFEKIIKASPSYLDAWVGLARVEGWRGKYVKSETIYLEALKQDADNSEALHGLMDNYRWRGESAKGIEIAKRILKSTPKDLSAFLALGVFYRDLGHIEQAIEAFKKVLEIDPARPDAQAELGQLHARALKLDDAVTELQKAIAINGNNTDAYITLGRVYAYKNKIRESVEIYGEALKKDPENLDALNGLARTYGYARQWKDSEAVFRKVLEISPHNGEAMEGLNRIGKLRSPSSELRHFYSAAADKELSMDSAAQLLQINFNYPIDPGKSLVFRAESGNESGKDRETKNTVYHVNRLAYGLGADWRLPADMSLVTRLGLAVFKNRGDNDSDLLKKQTHGEGFTVLQWEHDKHSLSFAAVKEDYLGVNAAGDAAVYNTSSISLAEDFDVTDRLSMLYELGYENYSSDRESTPKHTGRIRYRLPFDEIVVMEYKVKYYMHPWRKNHGISVTHKREAAKKLQYQLKYSPDYDSLTRKVGHNLGLLLASRMEPFSFNTQCDYSYNSAGLEGRLFGISTSIYYGF